MKGSLSERDWTGLVQAQTGLASLPDELRRCALDVVAAAGKPVFRLGARPARMYWVVCGEVRLVRRSRNGAEIVLQRAHTGFVAEASLESSRYHCDAVAATASRLLSFPIGAFRDAIRHDERFRTFWMTRLAREVRELRTQCERLSLRSAAERIVHFIETEGEDGRLELRRTRKAWAAELGLTHEALYRALASMRRSGIVAVAETRGMPVLLLATARPARRRR